MMARPKGKPRARAQIREAVNMYIAGDKVTDIAAKFGVSQPTISYWMKRHGERIGRDKFLQAQRTQGRRQESVPCERDAMIVLKVLMGMPAAQAGRGIGVSRARASYIVKTWTGRGYQPPMPFKAGDVIKQGKYQYLVVEANNDYATGIVLQTHGLICANPETYGKLKEPITIKDFHWYAGGILAEKVDDKG